MRKFNNQMNNTFADLLLSRTSVPYYREQQNAYPMLSDQDQAIREKAKDIWVYLRESAGSQALGFSDDWKYRRFYFSQGVRVALLTKTGLADERQATDLIRMVYPQNPVWQRVNPNCHPDLGLMMHTLPHPADKLHLAAITCRAMFVALRSWDCFNSVLVSGGWPWIRGYSSAYARMIYTVMTLLFAAYECLTFVDTGIWRDRILALAGKLVGDPSGQMIIHRVRKTTYLRDPKVGVPTALEARAPPMVCSAFITSSCMNIPLLQLGHIN